ncbi:MAG: alanine racemase [Firmicutes bacterium HGW-Firmicutes-7]|nr:MAG: alanine racemase [Firmicutes bacterium HGW-Firmicutes-7]
MKQYHRVFAEINIDYIEDNLKAIKDYVGHNKEVMVVIKADGYGHGAIPIARQLYEAGIDYIGVATIQEAIALRKYKIDIPIVVLGYSPVDEYENLVEYDIIQTVYKYSMAKGISDVAAKAGKNAKIHIKIDTGMMRIGFFPDSSTVDTIIKMHTLPNLEIEGLFTHFSQADGEDENFTIKQINMFDNFISNLEEKAVKIPKIHASNSAGMIGYKNAHYDIVRAGIALYGLYPSPTMDSSKLILKPSLSLKSNIIFLKEVEKGVPISYGGTYITSKRCKIATIPVGYGDGYPRSLSSKGRVLIRGQYAPIVGRICMDQFMVDVSDIDDVCEGDEAVLIGNQGEATISVEEIAEIDGTINYEIVCQLGKRIPRVYYKNNQIIYTIDYF